MNKNTATEITQFEKQKGIKINEENQVTKGQYQAY